MDKDTKIAFGLIILSAAVMIVPPASYSVARITGCQANYSDGERIGTVVKLSHKGMVFKSWEGTLQMQGYRSTQDKNSPITNQWDFNVRDEDVMHQIEDAMNSGACVRLRYRQWLIEPYTQESDYTVIGVEVMK